MIDVKDANDDQLLSKLRDIDKFALKFNKLEYTYNMFKAEKELKLKLQGQLVENENKSDKSESSEEDLISEESDKKIDRQDLEKAYQLYLSKKEEILKTYNNK